jgi:hypothetical protein
MIIRVNKEIIKSLKPCADRYENYLKYYSDFDGQLEEFLDLEKITYQDKIWLAVRLMPRFLVEVFAIDCAVRSAADAAANANSAAYADAAADSAAYANSAAAAADAADSAAYAAAYASNASAYAAADAAAYAAERQNQIESIIYLIQNEGETL